MLYPEAAYFDGNHCAHVAAREEHLRLERIRRHHAAQAEEEQRRQRALRRSIDLAKLQARSPLRAAVPQHDASALPMFAAANEPRLI